MMRLPPLRYLAPATLAEAVRMLAEAGPEAQPVAGGTDLYPNMKRLQVKPAVLVGLRRIRELEEIARGEDGSLVIGACVTLTHLAVHALVKELCAPLGEAARLVSTPLLRNMGTIGGNLCLDTRCHFINQTAFWRRAIGSCLKDVGDICRVAPGSSRCWAISSADLPPLLIALEAKINLLNERGERSLPLTELYRDDGIDYLAKAPGEILTRIMIPPLESTRATYLKLRRRDTFDFPALGVAAALRFNSDGACAAARIVLGGVTSRPIEMPQANQLVGGRLTSEAIAAVAEATALQARPLHLADFTNSYRKQMVGVYVGRVLNQLAN
jgi:4-hydroxybenzoyl-CoA reductase subunit beta